MFFLEARRRIEEWAQGGRKAKEYDMSISGFASSMPGFQDSMALSLDFCVFFDVVEGLAGLA